jgi:hypothetical protein
VYKRQDVGIKAGPVIAEEQIELAGEPIHTIKLEGFFEERCPDKVFLKKFLDSCEGMKFIVAGGAVRDAYCHNGKMPNDIDLFFKEESDFEETLSRFGEDKSKKIISKKENDYNISLEIEDEDQVQYKIQLINFVYALTIEELFQEFDFTICQFACDFENLYMGKYAVKDALSKQLVVNTLTYPVSSLRRILKYKDQGYSMCSGAMKDFILKVRNGDFPEENLDIEYID